LWALLYLAGNLAGAGRRMPALYPLIVDRKSCGRFEENVGFTPPDCGHYLAGNLAGAVKRMSALHPLIVGTPVFSRKSCGRCEENVGFIPLIVNTI
jgi:hypothetical protein